MIMEKAVICVDSVGLDGSVDRMKAFITSKLGVKVLTLFEVNPRRRRDEDDTIDRKAFRVCVYHDDRQRFRNDRVWPESMVVSDWFFKNKTSVDNNDRHKPRRIGSDSNKNGISQTHPDVPPPVDDISIDARNSEVDIDVDVGAEYSRRNSRNLSSSRALNTYALAKCELTNVIRPIFTGRAPSIGRSVGLSVYSVRW